MINSRQYQTVTINSTTSGFGSTTIDCSKSNPANVNKLNINPTQVNGAAPTGTSTLYQCGAPKPLTPSPIGTAQTCQNGIAGCICASGISTGCTYSLGDITGNSPDNLLSIRYKNILKF